MIADFKNGTHSVQSLDFAYCGDLLCEIGNVADKWWIFRTSGTASGWTKVVFEKNPLLSALKQVPDSPKVMGSGGTKMPASGAPESRLIPFDHSTGSEPAIRLEMKMASALKEIRKERESEVRSLAALEARVNRLTIVVCVFAAIAIVSFGAIWVNNGGISKLSNILLEADPEQQEEKTTGQQRESPAPMSPVDAKAESGTGSGDTNNAAKAVRLKSTTIPEPDKDKSVVHK